MEKRERNRIFLKKFRGGQELTKEEIRIIKEGRKKLKKQMKKAKVYTSKEFELTASSMGLYFDKNRWWALILWLLHGRALPLLLAATALLLAALLMFSKISQLRGHFTINLGGDMFRNGFSLSEDVQFTHPTSHLYSDPVENAPCISITSIPEDVDAYDGSHNGVDYFAYTFYLRNEGEDIVDYEYELVINSESINLSSAIWAMLFTDGEMTFYAKPTEEGKPEALPAYTDNTRGYRKAPLLEFAKIPEEQYELITTTNRGEYYRIIPKPFKSADIIASGKRESIKPMEVHKYTVVIWLEGDDPDCTDDLIGGHIGTEMNFRLIEKKKN